MLDAGDADALAARFAGTLQFGTAGLRGALGGGPNRMNLAVVRAATFGLARYPRRPRPGRRRCGRRLRPPPRLRARSRATRPACSPPRASRCGSPIARWPTPVTAYAVRHFGAAAGVMVTASHNPAPDNGYKVYDDTGSQIIPPTDAEIAAHIATAGPANAIPQRAGLDAHHAIGDDALDAYLDVAAGGRRRPAPRDAAGRLHADARRRPRRVPRVVGARRVRRRRIVVDAAGETRPRLPHRAVPEPRGAGRARPRARPRDAPPRRPAHRERPRRRPARGRGAARRRLEGPHRRRGRLAARCPPACEQTDRRRPRRRPIVVSSTLLDKIADGRRRARARRRSPASSGSRVPATPTAGGSSSATRRRSATR